MPTIVAGQKAPEPHSNNLWLSYFLQNSGNLKEK